MTTCGLTASIPFGALTHTMIGRFAPQNRSPEVCLNKKCLHFLQNTDARRQRRSRLYLYSSLVRWHHGDSALANGTLGEAGGARAPAARPPGALWRVSGAAQSSAWGDHPHAAPARGGRGADRDGVASLELGTAAEARLCPGYGTLPVVSAGVIADHRRHQARRGDPQDPPASEARGGPAPHGSGASPPGSLCVVLRLTAPGGSLTRPDHAGLYVPAARVWSSACGLPAHRRWVVRADG